MSATRDVVMTAGLALVSVLVAVSGGCDRQSSSAQVDNEGRIAAKTTGTGAATPSPVSVADIDLADVVEATPDYVIGISYPASASKYPELAALLKQYADEARDALMKAVAGRNGDSGAMLYDLSLDFTEMSDSPTVAAFAVDGSTYTGGAHGTPLVERFVWLPQRHERLTAQALIPDEDGWKAVSSHVRRDLRAQATQRMQEREEAAPVERLAEDRKAAKLAGRMFEEGTAPAPSNFSQFEPVFDPQGKIIALRFVFPPYQAGSYAQGIQRVEVPAEVLLPHVAEPYRGLFAGS